MADEHGKSFIENLELARNQYDKNPQVGSAAMLMAVVYHLEALGAGDRLIVPFHRLAASMCNAPKGIRDEHTIVAEREKKAARTPLQSRIDWGRGAAVVDMLREAGDKLPPSLSKVCRALGGSIAPDKLKDYRKRLRRQDRVLPPEAQQNYDAHMEQARAAVKAGATWRQVAESSLRFLEQSSPSPRREMVD